MTLLLVGLVVGLVVGVVVDRTFAGTGSIIAGYAQAAMMLVGALALASVFVYAVGHFGAHWW